jgi:PAS domain S-box-containing protein
MTEDKKNELVESANSIILRWLPSGEITFCNKFGLKFFGYAKNELLGKSIIGTIVPEKESSGRDLSAFMKQLALQPDLYSNNENENMRKDGHRVWIVWTNRAIRDGAGNIAEILSIGNDITDHKIADEASRESEQKLAAIIEFLPDATIVIDNTGKIIAWNRAVEEMTGFTAGEMLGKGDYEYAIPFYGDRRPLLIDLVQTPIEDLAERYAAVQKKQGILRGDAVCPMVRRERRYLSKWATPIYSLQGECIGAIESIRDMTDVKLTDEKLRANEAIITSMFNADPAGVTLTVGNVFQRVNRSFCKLSGYTEEELLGHTTDFVFTDSQESRRARETVYASLKTADVASTECRGMRKDGTVIDILLQSSPLHPGRPDLGLISAIMDITDRKRIEEDLKKSEEKFRALFDQSYQYMGMLTPDGTLIAANHSALSLIGSDGREVIGKPFWLAPWFRDLDKEQQKLQRAIRIAARGDFIRYETRHRALDDTLIVVDFSLKPVKDASGAVVLLIPEGRDITDLKRAQEDLLREKTFTDTLIHASPAFIAVISNAGKLIMMNNAFLAALGYTREEVVGKDYIETFVPSAEREKVRRFFETLITKYASTVNENRILTKNGSSILVEWRGQSFPRDDTHDFFIGVGIDITERRQAEESLRAAQQQLMQADKMIALGTLVAGVAHEINNPNNFVMLNTPLVQDVWKGIVPVLEEYYRDSGDFKAGGMSYSKVRDSIPTLLSGILDGSRRINTIVKELKNFARPDEVSMDQSVDINAAVKASLSLLHNMIAKSTHAFTLSYGDNLPRLPGNMQRLEQVFINLVQNACQSLPDADRGIHVATACDGNFVSITVRDEGTGISQEHLSQLMNPFFTTKRSAGGTGLGLSISQKIVADHGGRIDVQSRLGEGSTFRVLLPLEPVLEMKKILVADDDAIQRDLMRLALSDNLAYELRMVENGTDACIQLGKWRPDLILLDINMPGMNGVEVCRRIKNDPDFTEVQVIIVTGVPDRHGIKELQEMGFADICGKPFDAGELQDMVASVLDRKSSVRM